MSGNGNHNDNGGNRYSYSGADCKVFAYRGNKPAIFLESVQTISFSIHEPRGRARALGFRGVKGFSRSVREIAGTMIFTVIEDHPLAPLMTGKSGGNYTPGWSIDGITNGVGNFFGNVNFEKSISLNRVATSIPSFNLMLTYATEVISNPKTILEEEEVVSNLGVAPDLPKPGSLKTPQVAEVNVGRLDPLENYEHNPMSMGEAGYAASTGKPSNDWYGFNQTEFYNSYSAKLNQRDEYKVNVAGLVLEGVEIITEGVVTSVNDMITEIQVQFIARNYKEFSLGQYKADWKTDIDLNLAYERMKESYKAHAEWDRYESELEQYEIDLAIFGSDKASGNQFISGYESSTEYSPLIWNPEENIYTITSQTNLNPELEFTQEYLNSQVKHPAERLLSIKKGE